MSTRGRGAGPGGPWAPSVRAGPAAGNGRPADRRLARRALDRPGSGTG
jgi:hypothetical protein